MAKKSTLADTATALPAEILPPEAGDQGAAPEGTRPNAPETPAPAEDAPGAFIDDAGDASADDPLPGPAPTPEPLGAAAPGVALWRKKPVVVEAIQYTGNNLAEVFAFTGKHPKWDEWFASWDEYAAHVAKDRWVFKILTLEGAMEALPGDWIIRGTAGEHYPCKPEIFAGIYEPVEAVSSLPMAETAVPLGHNDMVEAYMAGAFGVHEEWQRAHAAGEAPPRGDPEFREAATNHADGYAARYTVYAAAAAASTNLATFGNAVVLDAGGPTPKDREEAIGVMTYIGGADPEAAARICWPGLFSPADDPAPEEAPLSEALLRATLAEIEARNSDLSRSGLIEELKAIEGVSIEDVPGGTSVISLHGVTATAAGGMPSVLRVWCQKARRAIMNGRAV